MRTNGSWVGLFVSLAFFGLGWSAKKIDLVRVHRSFESIQFAVNSARDRSWSIEGEIEHIYPSYLPNESLTLVLKRSDLQSRFMKIHIDTPHKLLIEGTPISLAYGDGIRANLTDLSLIKDRLKGHLDHPNSLTIQTTGFRNKIRRRISPYLQGDALGLFEGLLWGDTSLLSRLRHEQFKAMGLVHLLAVSGMNMGGVFMLSSLLALGLLRIPGALTKLSFLKLTGFIYTLLGGGYLYLAGFPVGLIRAFMMGWFPMIGWVLKGGSYSLTALFATFLGILFIDPLALGNYSFRLSFLSTYALLIAISLWNRLGTSWSRYPRPSLFRGPLAYTSSLIFISMFITVILAPYLVYAFGEAPLAASFLNVLFVPLTELILFPIAFIDCLLAMVFPSFLEYPARLFAICTGLAFRMVESFYPIEWLQRISLILNPKAVHLNLYYGVMVLCSAALMKKSAKWQS